jgi:NADH-quinone oxidoreductase subunit J
VEPLKMDVILFLIFAFVAVACAINLVLQSQPINAAISLIGVMGSLAVLYLLLGGEFIAAAQIIVYAGAIMVLFVFVIMLLGAEAERRTRTLPFTKYLGIPLLLGLVGLLAFIVRSMLPGGQAVTFGGFTQGTAHDVGMRLFTTYVLPFEVTSILILIAIIGAVVLARKEIQ